MNHVNADAFRERYAECPICHRSNVRLVDYAGGICFEEHPSNDRVTAYTEPQIPKRVPNTRDANLAYVRCPLSLATLVVMEDS